jgi:hypothetical protein
MRWPWPSDPPAHVFAGDDLGRDQVEILKFVYREDYEGNEAAIGQTALIRAYGSQLLTALVLHVATAKLRAFLVTCDAPGLDASDREALGDGIRSLRDLAATHADPDRLAFIRALIENQTRALTLFRSGKESASGTVPYQPISNQPADHIAIDTGLETSGMRELAAGVALIGREAVLSGWRIDLAQTAHGRRGALRVITSGSESAVFFAANPRAGVELESSGGTPVDSDDVVVLYSTGPVERLRRSPHGHFGRTGRSGARHVDMSTLLHEAEDLPDLERCFRQEAGL